MGQLNSGADHRANGGTAAPGALPPGVCALLSELLGRSVTSKNIPPYPASSVARRMVAVFEADDQSVVSVCVCDLAFAAYLGAALAMIPAGAAKESLAAGKCEAALIENFAEILNIGRQWFQKQGHHILPPQLYLAGQPIPPNVAAILSGAKSRVDAEVTIPGYGSGQLCIVS
jgi:hypothetical protein